MGSVFAQRWIISNRIEPGHFSERNLAEMRRRFCSTKTDFECRYLEGHAVVGIHWEQHPNIPEAGYLRCQNSWGPWWGDHGDFFIYFDLHSDFKGLGSRQTDFWQIFWLETDLLPAEQAAFFNSQIKQRTAGHPRAPRLPRTERRGLCTICGERTRAFQLAKEAFACPS